MLKPIFVRNKENFALFRMLYLKNVFVLYKNKEMQEIFLTRKLLLHQVNFIILLNSPDDF